MLAIMVTASTQLSAYVVSDLHICGCHSLFDRHASKFYQNVASHDITILNGDTFDFKRSVHRTAAETTRFALSWLQKLSQQFPHAQVYYLLGNHDCHESFVHALTQQLPTLPNIHLIPECLKIGTALFLHGDAVDLPGDSYDINIVRARYQRADPSMLSRLFAQAVTHLKINYLEYLRHSSKDVAQRLLRYLDATQPDFRGVTSNIYFGHTHVPFQDFVYEGISFTNTGSMIRGLRWKPAEITLSIPQNPS